MSSSILASLAKVTQLVTIVFEAVSFAVGMSVGVRQFDFLGLDLKTT